MFLSPLLQFSETVLLDLFNPVESDQENRLIFDKDLKEQLKVHAYLEDVFLGMFQLDKDNASHPWLSLLELPVLLEPFEGLNKR